MGKNVATDRLLGVHGVSHATTRVSHHLVCDKHSNIKLLAHLLNPVEKLTKDALAFRELSSARIINSEGCHDRVNDE